MPDKKKLKNRRLYLSGLIIISLLSLSTFIINQYSKYQEIEDRLNKAYSSTNFQSASLYKLFSTFSEADYLFRLYSVNFKEENFIAYSNKLDTIKHVIDSIATLPVNIKSIHNNTNNDRQLATEYLKLKKEAEDLIFYAKDSISYISSIHKSSNDDNLKVNVDSIVNKIINDKTFNRQNGDTIIRKRGNLFKRIFKSKDDTIVTYKTFSIQNAKELNTIIRNNIKRLNVQKGNSSKNKQIGDLKYTFEKLKDKERDLLFANFNLLNNLKIGIENLREIEFENYKKTQKNNFQVYKQNTKTIKIQLTIVLSLMVLMIILIISYQRLVYFYEKKLIKEKNYANQIAEEKTSILANISHEIRGPINSLKGLINIIKNNNNQVSIDAKIIDNVEHDIEVINSSINDILSLSKLESESLQVKKEEINVYNLIEDLISLHKYQAKSKKLKLENKNSIPSNTTINSNPFRIRQILSNLISNAIKYTERGSVTVLSKIENNTLIVQVIDTGVGMNEEQIEQVFRKYYVADTKGKSGSFGLGLYISEILANQLGGKLHAKSILGKGTTFTFELPINEIKSVNIDKEKNYTIDKIPEDLNIVFIDDNKINLFLMEQLFKNRKRVQFFIESTKALEHISSTKVDIVITDLKMPVISGWEVLEKIKTATYSANIKVFACTSEPLLLNSKSTKYNFDGEIDKPINEQQLVKTILSNL